MPFYVMQHQLTGRHFALISRREDRSRLTFPTFEDARARADEASGWDGECGVYFFLDDEEAHRFVRRLSALAQG